MARTHKKNWRVYVDGYDMSGYGFDIGPLVEGSEPNGNTAFSDAIHGFYPGQTMLSVGTLNTNLDNTASTGSHTALNDNALRVVTVAIGDVDAPAAGDPIFTGEFEQKDYLATGEGMVTATIGFEPSISASALLYNRAWGRLLHPLGAETAVNSSTSDYDYGAQTTLGGYMVYHCTTSNGTVALKVQDADTDADGNYSDLVSSGDIDASATPQSGIVALSTSATVERYVRWQLTFNTATTATFVIGFVRRLHL